MGTEGCQVSRYQSRFQIASTEKKNNWCSPKLKFGLPVPFLFFGNQTVISLFYPEYGWSSFLSNFLKSSKLYGFTYQETVILIILRISSLSKYTLKLLIFSNHIFVIDFHQGNFHIIILSKFEKYIIDVKIIINHKYAT